MNLATMAAKGGPSLSFGSYLTNMVKTQGVMSLYSGLSAGLLRQCFYATSRVGFFEGG
jgi:solute carrier family 25 oxoglutarate transporter 11